MIESHSPDGKVPAKCFAVVYAMYAFREKKTSKCFLNYDRKTDNITSNWGA